MYKQINENDELMNAVKPFLEKGEIAKKSESIQYQNKFYREIIIEKKQLMTRSIQGYIYVSENGEVVKDKSLQKELSRLGYYYEIFFDDRKETSVIKALKKEGDLNRDTNDYYESGKALDKLKKEEELKEAESMKNTMSKVLNIKINMNEKINELSSFVSSLNESKAVFNEEILLKVYGMYENVMKVNFENVKTIGEVKDYCDKIKDAAKKKRKKLTNRFSSKTTLPLFKLDYQLAYYKKIIRTYERVLGMNTSQYMKFFKGNQEKNIDERFSLIRR